MSNRWQYKVVEVKAKLFGGGDTANLQKELDDATGDPEAARTQNAARIPLGRYGRPEEFGRVAAFVLSPAASFVSGAFVPVDGGSLRSL